LHNAMNETVANEVHIPKPKSTPEQQRKMADNWGYLGYSLLCAALVVGWLLRDRGYIDPAEGIGYWLGIVGGSLMLFLLLYPAGKKSRLLRRLGLIKHWFRIHILFGLLGPLLILYHSSFKVAAINSKVALYCMLTVAISGIVGRHFYARIHRGLHGKRTSVEELRGEIADSVKNTSGIAAFLPDFVNELQALSIELLGDNYTKTIGVHRSLAWSFKFHYLRARFYFRINRELRARAVSSEPIRGNFAELRSAANRYMDKQVRLLRRVAQLSFYERLFSIWHVFHMPLFFLLVISASIHVLAVHMF